MSSSCIIIMALLALLLLLGVVGSSITNDDYKYYKGQQQQRQHHQQRRQQDRDNNEPANSHIAEQMLSSFFERLNYLEEQYGTNLVTVQDATDVYPILLSKKTGNTDDDNNNGGCPMDYNPNEKMTSSCYTPIITIHDRITNPLVFDQSQPYLPEVLFLGGIDTPQHMDMLGPSSIYETLKLLLDCAACEALSPWVVLPASSPRWNDTTTTTTEIPTATTTTTTHNNNNNNNALTCRNELQSQGIDDKLRKWLARLVATRKIIAVPIVDVPGFYHRLRMEESSGQSSSATTTNDNADNAANKMTSLSSSSWSQCDFPYPAHWKPTSSSSESNNNCMSTFPSQLINEVFRSHAIQLGLAFHGHVDDFLLPSGWIGVPSWKSEASLPSDTTPSTIATVDEDAMIEISWSYSMFGRSTNNNNEALSYSVQSIPPKSKIVMNEQTENFCQGATMEHWAFSAGMTMIDEPDDSGFGGPIWLEQCDGSEYALERTNRYDSLSLRSFVASVVASSSSEYPRCLPGFELLGDETLCLSENNDSNFFFDSSRLGSNLRMSILATELVEPWASIRSVAGVEFRDEDIIPSSPRLPEKCPQARAMTLPESLLMKDLNITWTVGGAFTVTETAIMHGKWDVLDKKIFDCVTQPTKQELDAFFTILRDFEVMEGETAQEMEDDVSFTPVQSGVTRWHPSQLTTSAVRATPAETTFSASLDLSDYKVGDVVSIFALARTDQREHKGGNQPQSSIVNARSNPDWSHTYTTIDGSLSAVHGRLDWFSVPVTITIGEQPGFFSSNRPTETSVRISDIGLVTNDTPGIEDLFYPILAAIIVVALVFFCAFCREESDGTDVFSVLKERRAIKRQKISMDEFFSEEARSLELT
ncbi:hypothetical protein ACHAXM_007929 [Skeletonema potamos]